ARALRPWLRVSGGAARRTRWLPPRIGDCARRRAPRTRENRLARTPAPDRRETERCLNVHEGRLHTTPRLNRKLPAPAAPPPVLSETLGPSPDAPLDSRTAQHDTASSLVPVCGCAPLASCCSSRTRSRSRSDTVLRYPEP